MPERLPVGDTLNEAFQFGLRRIGTVIRLGWLPMALVLAMGAGLVRLIFDISTLESSEDPSILLNPEAYLTVPAPVAVLLGVVVLIIAMLLMAGFMASVYRLVALGEDRGGFFDLRFDGPSVRVFWAQLILALIGYGIFAIAFLLASVVAGGSDGVAVVLFLAVVFALPALAFINVRLAAFPAGSAAENRLFFLGAFDLSKGRFWSIFGVYFFLFVALMFLGIIYTLLSGMLEMLASLGGAGGAIFWVVQIAMMIFYQAFVLGVQLSTQAIIYRRLKTGA